ncbi:MAG: transposase [Phycisphaerae bacterium]|nr:transposase [Phycisphaerae bacterium]
MSYTDLNYHIVYATKDRRPILSDDILPRLVKYTGGILRELGGQLLEAGGTVLHLMSDFSPGNPLSPRWGYGSVGGVPGARCAHPRLDACGPFGAGRTKDGKI